MTESDGTGGPSSADPRVGTIGGSYGGGFQFAVAGIDARVDALVPMITWNDLSYSLGPNNTGQTTASRPDPGRGQADLGDGFSLARHDRRPLNHRSRRTCCPARTSPTRSARR